MLATFSGRRIGGWHYVTIVPVGAPPPAPGKTPPKLPGWVVSTLIRMSRRGPHAAAGGAPRDGDGCRGPALDEWDDHLRDELRARILAYQDVDLGGLDDEALAAELSARAEMMRRSAELHFRLAMPYSLGIFDLVEFCRARIGWPAGADARDAVRPRRRRLRSGARARGDRRAAAATAWSVPRRTSGSSATSACRALDIEVAEPTLAESPHLLNALIEAAADAGSVDRRRHHRPRRDAGSPIEHAPRCSGSRIAEFDGLLKTAERVYGLRDDNVFLAIDAPLALVRYAALEVGTSAGGARDSRRSRGRVPSHDRRGRGGARVSGIRSNRRARGGPTRTGRTGVGDRAPRADQLRRRPGSRAEVHRADARRARAHRGRDAHGRAHHAERHRERRGRGRRPPRRAGLARARHGPRADRARRGRLPPHRARRHRGVPGDSSIVVSHLPV